VDFFGKRFIVPNSRLQVMGNPIFCCLLWLGLTVAAQARPDLVVAKLCLHGDQLVVQYQNQGARGSAMPFDLRIGRWEKERMLEPTVVVRGLPVPDELGLLETKPISGRVPKLKMNCLPVCQSIA
jgi:hypothetical protein